MAAGAQAGRKAAEETGGAKEPAGAHGASSTADPKAELSDLAGTIADAAKEQSRSLLDAAKGQATSFADGRKDTVAQAVADIAASLRDTGGGFADRPNIQGFVGSAADGLDQLASGIRDRSFAELYGEVEDFARRQPVALGVGAVAVGFLLARFIKSSAEELSDAHAVRSAEAAQTRRRARPAA